VRTRRRQRSREADQDDTGEALDPGLDGRPNSFTTVKASVEATSKHCL
jgi:hypothetical protein